MRHHYLTLCLALVAFVVAGALPSFGMSSPDDSATVQIYLATEHVPAKLASGSKVSVHSVNSKTITSRGVTKYSTTVLVTEAKVTAVETIEKPADPEQAVKVDLSVTKAQAAKIERVKKQLVTVNETDGNGKVETKKKPVTLRLEMVK